MPEKDEPFANPPPPPSVGESNKSDGKDAPHPMTNEDFRKLLMTPRATTPTSAPTRNPEAPSTVRASTEDDKAERRKKKKNFYAKLKKQEDDKMQELALKYRDRAQERRKGANPDYQSEDPISTTAGYRAVAPDAKSGMDAAERRRQMIQESKFLGGDMEHTHLVKGLDYALLQKVRSEITLKEKQEEDLDDEGSSKPVKLPEPEEQISFKSKMAKSVHHLVFRHKLPERNDHFLPGRMAYIIELDDDYAESDIPTTLLRSKTDCPNIKSQATLTTNDIVINKLTQILSYLRQGARNNKKVKRKDKVGGKPREEDKKVMDDSIYGDIGDYVPTLAKAGSKDDSAEKRRKSYFEKPIERYLKNNYDQFFPYFPYFPYLPNQFLQDERDEIRDFEPEAYSEGTSNWAPNLIPEPTTSFAQEDKPRLPAKVDESKLRSTKMFKRLNEPDSYAECYPGAPETADAIDDSDDEVDYTKMDMGNKKGPIGRWDFDTQEEYSDYMNQKEALPKAAFQYGVKMADGRKTRRTGQGKKDEKAELDREWQKISQIIAKRKATGVEGDPEYKMAKY